MKKNLIYFLAVAFVCCTTLLNVPRLYAQSDGENLDFSLGDFTNWDLSYGDTALPTYTLGTAVNNHDIMTAPGVDPKVSALSVLPPTGENSCRIGNFINDRTKARLEYILDVDDSNTIFYYDYAVVIEDATHTLPEQQPALIIDIRDSDGNLVETTDCSYYMVADDFGTADFQLTTFSGILYKWKDWQRVGLDLSDYIGENITIGLEARDCYQTGHRGYSYVSAGVFDSEITLASCGGGLTVELAAPEGFSSYTWDTDPEETSQTIEVDFDVSETYTCVIESENGCEINLSIDLEDFLTAETEYIDLPCDSYVELSACIQSEDADYFWSPTTGVSDPSAGSITIVPTPATYGTSVVYTLTTTFDGNDFLNTYEIYFEEIPFSAGDDISLACGEIGQLGPCEPSATATYAWTPTDNLSNPNIANPFVSLGTTAVVPFETTYSLTVTTTTGIEYTSDVVVSYNGNLGLGADIETWCETEDIGPCVIIEDAEYSWSPTTGLSSSDTPNTTVSFDVPGTGPVEYTLTATMPNGDVYEDQITLEYIGFDLGDCCDFTDKLYLANDDNSEDIIAQEALFPSITFTGSEVVIFGQEIYVEGDFYVNRNTFFAECDFKMAANANIIVEEGYKLTIRDCNIEACQEMWRGIYINHPTSEINVSLSSIKHANDAIRATNKAKLTATGNTFEANDIGILIVNYNDFTTDYSLLTISDNDFLAGTLITPMEGMQARSGIELKDSKSVAIPGNSSSLLNLIADEMPGSIDTDYIDGTDDNPLSNYFNGFEYGIYMRNTETCQFFDNEFENCDFGIYSIDSNNDTFFLNAFIGTPGITQNGMDFTNSRNTGIYLSYFRNLAGALSARNTVGAWSEPYIEPHIIAGSADLNYPNYFQNNVRAMRIEYMRTHTMGNTMVASPSSYINVMRGTKINENTITQINNGNVGIDVKNYLMTPSGTDVDIVENTIEILQHGTGIWVSSLNSVMQEEIDIDPTLYGHKVAIVENDITMDNMGTSRSYGIRVDNSRGIAIGFNTVTSLDPLIVPGQIFSLRGISLAQSPRSFVYQNTMTRLGEGFRGVGDLVDTQYRCNIFQQDYFGMYFENDPAAGVFTMISGQGAALVDPTKPSAGADTHENEWFELPYGPGSLRIGGDIANVISFNWHWNNTDPIVFSHGDLGVMINVPEAVSATVCGDEDLIDEWTEDIDYGMLLSIASESVVYGAMPTEAAYYDNNYAYSELRENPGIRNPDTPQGIVMSNFYELLDNSNFREFYDIVEHIRHNELEEALQRNAEVLSDLLIEQNQQQVNSIYINQLLTGAPLTTDEIALLESIAFLTPYLGGDAVYTARAMLGIDPDEYSIAYRVAEVIDSTPAVVSIYPNPGNGELTLAFSKTSTEKSIFECYNIQGQLLESFVLPKGIDRKELHLETLDAGIYLIRVWQEDDLLLNEKLIITK